MRPSALAPSRPSESEIAAPISSTVTNADSWVATSAKIQVGGAEAVDGGRELVEDDHRQAGRERELGDVEDDLDGRQAAVDQQHDDRADQPGDHEVDRRREQQAEHERQVAERERVRAAAEVQVDHAALGGEEAQRQAPPRDVHAGVELGRWSTGPASSAAEAMTIAMFSDQTPPSADNRRRAPFRGDMRGLIGGASRNPEALDGCATGRGPARGAQQQVAGEADDAVEHAVELVAGHVAHDLRPLPRLGRAPGGCSTARGSRRSCPSTCRRARSRRRRAGP